MGPGGSRTPLCTKCKHAESSHEDDHVVTFGGWDYHVGWCHTCGTRCEYAEGHTIHERALRMHAVYQDRGYVNVGRHRRQRAAHPDWYE